MTASAATMVVASTGCAVTRRMPLPPIPDVGFCAVCPVAAALDGLGGASACVGDSGGPLVQGGKETGTVSFCPANCSPSYPSVYTNVGAYRLWIHTQTGI